MKKDHKPIQLRLYLLRHGEARTIAPDVLEDLATAL